MRRILLDNILKGFPADEHLLRTIDEQREAVKQTCLALYGYEAVILSGLEISYTGSGDTATTTISGGWLWMGGEILKVEAEEFMGMVEAGRIWFRMRGETITAIYEDGETLPAYDVLWGQAFEAINPTGGNFKNYTAAKRINLIETASILEPQATTGLSGSLKVTAGHCGLAINGIITMPKDKTGSLWQHIGNVGVAGKNIIAGREALYPVAVKWTNELAGHSSPYEQMAILVNDYACGYLKIDANGGVCLRVEGVSQDSTMTTAHVNINITMK